MRLTPRQNIILTLILALVAVSPFGWVYVSMAASVANASASLREIGGRIAALEEERRQVRALEKMLEDRGADFARIDAFFVNRDRPVDFIEQVEDLARRTQNTLVLGVEGPADNSGELGFRLTIDGSQSTVSRYLKLFELLPYALRVEDLVFQRIAEGGRGVLPGPGTPTARLILVVKVKSR